MRESATEGEDHMDRSLSLSAKSVKPYSDAFGEALQSYCRQMAEAIRGHKHHDQRRNLFITS